MTCAQEMCRNWSGSGCVCAVFGIEPAVAREARRRVLTVLAYLGGRETAERILAAVRTDRAVQDAMLAALAEGGRLVEEEGLWPCPSRHYDRDHNGEWCDEACRSYEGHAGDHECVSGRHWPRTADDLPRKVHWIEPEWREVPNA